MTIHHHFSIRGICAAIFGLAAITFGAAVLFSASAHAQSGSCSVSAYVGEEVNFSFSPTGNFSPNSYVRYGVRWNSTGPFIYYPDDTYWFENAPGPHIVSNRWNTAGTYTMSAYAMSQTGITPTQLSINNGAYAAQPTCTVTVSPAPPQSCATPSIYQGYKYGGAVSQVIFSEYPRSDGIGGGGQDDNNFHMNRCINECSGTCNFQHDNDMTAGGISQTGFICTQINSPTGPALTPVVRVMPPVNRYIERSFIAIKKNAGACPVPKANLIAGTVSPASAVAGTATTFSVTVSNNGDANAAATQTRFQRATSVAGAGAATVATVATAATNQGVSRTVSTPYTWTAAGTFYMRACADIGAVVAESDESDNCGAWRAVAVTAPVALARANLTATGISPISVVAGQATNFSTTVLNIGNAATDAPLGPPGGGGGGPGCGQGGCQEVYLHGLDLAWLKNFFLSRTEVAHAAQAIPTHFQRATSAAGANATSLGVTNTDTLAAGASRVVTRSATLTAGTWYLRACADNNASFAGIITESNEADNCGEWTKVTAVPAEVPAVSCAVSSTAVSVGQGVTYTVAPSGGATAPYAWTGSGGGSYGTGISASRTFSAPGLYDMQVRASNTSNVSCPRVTVAASWCATGATSLSIEATPNRVRAGEPVELVWDASNVLGEGTTCTVTGPGVSWSSAPSSAPLCGTSGSAVQTITTQSTYTLTCGGQSKSVTVNVIPSFTEF